MANLKTLLLVAMITALVLAVGATVTHNWLAMVGWIVASATQYALSQTKDIAGQTLNVAER